MAISSYLEVITPNFTEVQKILNRPLTSTRDIEEGALEILFLGAKSILITNAQPNDALFSHDYWTNGHDSFWMASPKILNNKVRGKGRILSSAITAFTARGYSVKDAIVIAKMVVARELQNVIKHKDETFFLNTFPEDQAYLPFVSSTPLLELPKPFESCQLGLYPIVDSNLWLEKLLPLGVKCIQLRIKNMEQSALVEEIKKSIMLAKQYDATLFINDHWELALELGAEGIHLGQEDLQSADIDRIRQSGCYLGISTCGYFDIARAHALSPSYIACGPIYPTKSKVITAKPLGIEELKRMRTTLNYPLVAIGGINLEQLPEILEAGVEGVSVISAITAAKSPIDATQKILKEMVIT